MQRSVYASDYWRHHVSFAPDFEVEVKAGESCNIDLSAYLIQGARDIVTNAPDKEVLSKMPMQRGWRLDVAVKQPANGRAAMSTYLDGMVYVPNPGFVGEDCFNYQLSNGTQKSNYGRVKVTVVGLATPA